MSDQRGVDRRKFLQCMAWTGTGLLWSVAGGVLSSRAIGVGAAEAQSAPASFSFAQISDTHIGFKGAANPDAMGTFEAAIARIKALDPRPAFLIHTGDITHGQKAGAFDVASEALKGTGVERTCYVPGEHDVFADGGAEYLNRFAAGRPGRGWQSFDYGGVHFVGLDHYADLEALLSALRTEGIAIGELALEEADLEDVFLKIMSGELRAPGRGAA